MLEVFRILIGDFNELHHAGVPTAFTGLSEGHWF